MTVAPLIMLDVAQITQYANPDISSFLLPPGQSSTEGLFLKLSGGAALLPFPVVISTMLWSFIILAYVPQKIITTLAIL